MDIQRIYKSKSKRQSKKIQFKYIDKKTKLVIRDPKIIERIKSLKIPPNYKRVVISRSSRNKIQAIGVDSKNRKQYIYNPKFIEKQKTIKFHDLILFGKFIKKIRVDINKIIRDTASGVEPLLSKKSLIALILFLVDNCHFRVGCEKYKLLYKTYGVTTLNKSHFKILNNAIKIEFIGKKGVLNKSRVGRHDVCKILQELCVKNTGNYLFYSKEENNNNSKSKKIRITEKHVNNYLKKYDPKISVKMFRTWKANYILLKEILEYPFPKTKEESEKNIREIVKSAAKKLHHTKNVSKKSYMNNKIMDLYISDNKKFKDLFVKIKKDSGKLPNIDKLLSLLLKYFDEQN